MASIRAEQIAGKLPLVRVLVPKDPNRRAQHIRRVFGDGILEPAHESEGTRRLEEKLKLEHSVYFHSARGDETYGSVLFAFRNLDGPLEATPFGLGGIDCDATNLSCARKSCLQPVSHFAVDDKKRYVETKLWRDTDWRPKAAEHLDRYFACDDFVRYFERNVLPCQPDPDGIHAGAEETGKIDYRHFTIELRLLGPLDLSRALRQGQLLFCCIPSDVKSRSERENLAFYRELLDTGRDLVNPSRVFDMLGDGPQTPADVIKMANSDLRREALR
ncbi:MAG TPA: hypothetical protein VJV79_18725 [Polyangiaceae bacterium]|nr:hypothetical protein [Polyangiaceae bacterium]